MTQYQKIQEEEVEALEFIYLSDMTIVKSSPPFKFEIVVRPFLASFDDISQDAYNLKMTIEFVKDYPQKSPKIELETITNINTENLLELDKLMAQIMFQRQKSNLFEQFRPVGIPFVFELVESARDWIHHNLIDFIETKEEENKEEEYFYKPQFDTFTLVTIENFNAWKKKFDDDNLQQKTEQEIKQEEQFEEKISGKKWFLLNRDKFQEPEGEEDEVDGLEEIEMQEDEEGEDGEGQSDEDDGEWVPQ